MTSGIIPEFAEEVVEVAEGGEMVRKEGRGKGGEGRVEGEMKGEKQKRAVGKKVYWERRMTTEEREGEREERRQCRRE